MSDYANDWVGQTLSGGRYRVDAKLGEGGMGFVYKVWDRNLDTDVVIKAPRRSMLDDPEFASRFALEIRSLVKLSHPNIVKVSDVGEHEGLPFAVMQYLSGGTLDERQDYGRDGRPLPASPASVSGWLPGMAAALDFIHGKGYIHRDVKPANILFDTHGHPYLSDFGVAKVLSDVEASVKKGPAMTGIGIVLGTPDYMAPELIMGNSFDGRVDQYALAATAYEILCGRKPFTGDTPTAILVRQTTQDPPPMAELPASASQAITRVILKGLAKKPADRYRTCVEFATALVAALAKAGPAPAANHRLACPSCGVGFAATADLTNFKGRKSKCRSCGSPFRISDDGQSLLSIDPDAMPTPSGSVEVLTTDRPAARTARDNRTVKLDAMPNPARADLPPTRAERTMKLDAMPNPAGAEHRSPPRAERTMKLEAMPGPIQDGLSPARAGGTMKLQAMPASAIQFDESSSIRGDEPEKRSVLPWVMGAVGVAAAAILGIFLATRPSSKAVEVAVAPMPSGASIPPPKPQPPKLKAPTPAPENSGLVSGANSKGLESDSPGSNGSSNPPASNSKGGFGQEARGGGFSPGDPAPTPPSPPVEPERVAAETSDRPDPEVPAVVEKRDEDHARPGLRPVQAKTNATLKQIVADPKEHLDEVISPSDLLHVNTNVNGLGLAVRSHEGAYRDFQSAGSSFEIVLKPELAAHLRDGLNRNVLVNGEYPAYLKMRIEKGPRNNHYRGVVEWLELLYFVDPRHLENGPVLNKALVVVSLNPNGLRLGYNLSSHKEWEPRLIPTHIVPNLRIRYKKEGRPSDFYKDLAMKAVRLDRASAVFFHNWIKSHIP